MWTASKRLIADLEKQSMIVETPSESAGQMGMGMSGFGGGGTAQAEEKPSDLLQRSTGGLAMDQTEIPSPTPDLWMEADNDNDGVDFASPWEMDVQSGRTSVERLRDTDKYVEGNAVQHPKFSKRFVQPVPQLDNAPANAPPRFESPVQLGTEYFWRGKDNQGRFYGRDFYSNGIAAPSDTSKSRRRPVSSSYGGAVGVTDGRKSSLKKKRTQLANELRSKEIMLKQAEAVVEKAKDSSVALNVVGDILGMPKDLNLKANGRFQEMRDSDFELKQVEVDKQLTPLILERNKHAAQYGENHPTIKELDAKLNVMKSELKQLTKQQSHRMLELIEENERDGEPSVKAAEAVTSMIYSARAEVEVLKSQLAEIELQSADEMPIAKTRVPDKAAGLDELSAQDEAFSTFSLHVSDVSFKLAQAALAKGEWPEADKIRIEEFVNAFDYGDPMPSQNEKVACRVEQCVHPFLQQRNLMRVSMRTAAAGRASSTPLRLTFLLDNSGSMERVDRQQTVRRAFSLLAEQLKPIDQVTLISFARQPRLLADKVSGQQSQQLVQLVQNLPSEGGTNIEAALQLAFEKAREQHQAGSQNRIILLTDGAVNLGNANPESLSQMVTHMRDAGIAFDAAGIGADGLNDEVLEALTRKGDGRYYLLDSAEDADEGFVSQIAGALRPSAKNVKVQIEFNPKRVGRYKLLGFEKHLLKKEDFRDDKVDAAEMAAAEAGVAVYQFQAKPDGEGDIGSLFVRFQDLSTGKMIENCWPIPYESDAPRADQATTSLKIATSAALLAAKLRGEPLGETVDLKTLAGLISGMPQQDQSAKRVQQLQLMIQQARQVSGN